MSTGSCRGSRSCSLPCSTSRMQPLPAGAAYPPVAVAVTSGLAIGHEAKPMGLNTCTAAGEGWLARELQLPAGSAGCSYMGEGWELASM